MSRAIRRRCGWLIAACLVGAASPAAAQGEDPTSIVVRYHEAARAAELCAGRQFTRAQQDKLAVMVGQATQHRLTVGEELIAIRASRAEMEARVTANGCGDPLVVDALRFFARYEPRLR
jgi:hypothetical protein